MPTVRAALLLSIAAVLSGCASAGKSEAPDGVNLAGNWKLDPAASDDPQKLLDKMRAEAFKIIDRRRNAPPPLPPRSGRPGAAGGPSTGQGQQGQSAEDEPPPPPPPGTVRPDPLRYSPMAHIIRDTVERGDFLAVRQDADEFVLDYGTSRRTFTPGGHSVVSAEGGVGDQTSGWKGKSYVIHVRDQTGPDVTEEYSLSGDGKELIMKLHVGSAELPAVDLTRIYRPTTEAAPQQLPNND
jgi:hypothetical protein